MRALKNKPFWVMESHSEPAGWGRIGLNPRPGEARLWAYQAIAHGAVSASLQTYAEHQIGKARQPNIRT